MDSDQPGGALASGIGTGPGTDGEKDIESQSLLAANTNANTNNVGHYPAYLLNIKDKNNKTPIELAIKKKQKPTELLLRKYMDKHTSYNQSSALGKLKLSLVQFFSIQNWLLWTGLVSEGGGRPPKFILSFVIVNLFMATCVECFVYAPVVWMAVLKSIVVYFGVDLGLDLDVNAGSNETGGKYTNRMISFVKDNTSEEMVRLSSGEGYMALHCATWLFMALTWTTLYLVNQTDPGVVVTSSAFSSSSMADHATNRRAATNGRITFWIQLLIRRLCSFLPWLSSSFFGRDDRNGDNDSGGGSSSTGGRGIGACVSSAASWLCCCTGIGSENRRIRREMHSLSIELRRKYEDTLESFASSTGDCDGGSDGRAQLCHSCHIVRPLRSKHCRVMNRCILLFDHHCPFVGTTIGLYNYKYFYLFILAFTVADILFTTTGFLYWKHGPTAADKLAGVKESMETWTLMVVIYFSIYIIMSGGLSIYHTQLICHNLTTNEHQNLHKYGYLKKKNADGSLNMDNPFNRGFLRNLMSRFAPGRDSYVLDLVDSQVNGAAGKGHVSINAGKNKKADVVEMSSSSHKKTDDNGGGRGEKMDLVAHCVS